MREALTRTASGDSADTRASRFESIANESSAWSREALASVRELGLEACELAASIAGAGRPELLLKWAIAWKGRIHGDPHANLTRATQVLDRCLAVPSIGLDVIGLGNNAYGSILTTLGAHDRAQLSKAEARFNEALTAFERIRASAEIAMVHLNLGNLHVESGQPVLAIAAYRKAVERYTALDLQEDVALAERNLGVTLLDQVPREASDVEEAIRILHSAQSRISEQRDPHGVATTLSNLGKAYAFKVARGAKDQDDNFQRARDAYDRAAAIFARLGEATNARIAYMGAGGICYELQDWKATSERFSHALVWLDRVWHQAASAQSELALSRDGARIYDFAVLAALNDRRIPDALRLVEQGRQKLLIERYYSTSLRRRPETSSENWEQLEAVRGERAGLRREMTRLRLATPDSASSLPVAELVRRDDPLRAREESLLREIRRTHTEFAPVPTPPDVEAVSALARGLHANICILRATSKGTFILTFDAKGVVRDDVVERATSAYWQELLIGASGWMSQYSAFRAGKPFAMARWLRQMETTLGQAYEVLIRRCLSMLSLPALEEAGVDSGDAGRARVYFLPGGILDFLPWHAVCHERQGNRISLLDVADVGYLPSLRLLEESFKRVARSGPVYGLHGLLAQDAPPFGECEMTLAEQAIGTTSFQKTTLASDRVAALQQLSSASAGSNLLVGCHAKAVANDALRSGLFLTGATDDNPDLTIADLLSLDLTACPLVLLSACETSFKEMHDPSDECLSVANTIFAAGAHAVVGTQWVVDGRAASLWTSRFLQNHAVSSDLLGSACEASRWLKRLTPTDATVALAICHNAPAANPARLALNFSHPFSWASHRFVGASMPKLSRRDGKVSTTIRGTGASSGPSGLVDFRTAQGSVE